MSAPVLLTLGQAAKQLGCKTWQLQRAFERGLLEEPTRVGIQRVVSASDIPKIRSVMKKAGYVK